MAKSNWKAFPHPDKAYDYDFASWVFGDSMTPEFENGSVAPIRQTTFDYDGAVYAVEWDGQTYIKHVYREKYGLRLVSTYPEYPDRILPPHLCLSYKWQYD